jgi:OOP family OmpA-OmpF porin
MGVPTPTWGEAAEAAIGALAALGGGSVTFSNADVTLAAAEGTSERAFDRVVGELEAALPDVFALYAVLPETPDPDVGPPEFIATLSPEGQVQLRGRVPNDNLRDMADSFARARFGSEAVYTAARTAPDLPPSWAPRVLSALEALATLNHGAVTVTPDMVSVSGSTGNADANAEIARLLAEKLGEEATFDIQVVYQEQLDPVAALPTADECEAGIEEILARGKITFEPGNATIDESALGTMDAIAELLQECGDLRLEIQGHTDSQGREEMNLALSQARAQSVLNELQARRVLTSSFSAKGYGETKPIADNDSEEGREANRRIEFRLIRPDTSFQEVETTLESIAESGDIEASETGEGGDGDE